MTKLTSSVLSVIGLSVLTACGGGGRDLTADFENRVLQFEGDDRNTEVIQNIADTTTGTVSYVGFSSITTAASDDTPAEVILGNATATVDFDNNTVAGSATDFIGANVTVTENGDSITASNAVEYSGTLQLSNGVVTRSQTGTDFWAADYDGTLTGGGDTIVVDLSTDRGIFNTYTDDQTPTENMSEDFEEGTVTRNGEIVTPEVIFNVDRQ